MSYVAQFNLEVQESLLTWAYNYIANAKKHRVEAYVIIKNNNPFKLLMLCDKNGTKFSGNAFTALRYTKEQAGIVKSMMNVRYDLDLTVISLSELASHYQNHQPKKAIDIAPAGVMV